MARDNVRSASRRRNDSSEVQQISPDPNVAASTLQDWRTELRSEMDKMSQALQNQAQVTQALQTQVSQALHALLDKSTDGGSAGSEGTLRRCVTGETEENPSRSESSADKEASARPLPQPAVTPTPAAVWSKGGTLAWGSIAADALGDYPKIRSNHSALEDIFIDFEQWARELCIPPDLQYKVLMSYFPAGDRLTLTNAYTATRAKEDYRSLRMFLLNRTGLHEIDAPAYYVAQLSYPLHADRYYSPSKLQAHFEGVLRKLRRATEGTTRMVYLDDPCLAWLFLESLPRACRARVIHNMGSRHLMTFDKVVTLAMGWENDQQTPHKRASEVPTALADPVFSD